jgi:hypothetical protein
MSAALSYVAGRGSQRHSTYSSRRRAVRPWRDARNATARFSRMRASGPPGRDESSPCSRRGAVVGLESRDRVEPTQRGPPDQSANGRPGFSGIWPRRLIFRLTKPALRLITGKTAHSIRTAAALGWRALPCPGLPSYDPFSAPILPVAESPLLRVSLSQRLASDIGPPRPHRHRPA